MAVPGFPFVTGEMPDATTWNKIFAQYPLATNGVLNSPTINTPTISTIISPTPVNFVINGATIPFPGPTGPYLPIGGGTLAGTLSQAISPTWSGPSWPPTSALGIQFSQAFTGAPSAGYSDPSGGIWIPYNFINITGDTLTFDQTASSVIGMLIRHQAGGSGATGGRIALAIDFQNTGPIATSNGNDFYSALQLSTYASYNITGSTALSPKGNYYGWNVYTSAKAHAADSSPIYLAGLGGCEIDYTIESGGSVKSGVGILIANFSPIGTTETSNGAGIVISSAVGGGAGFKSYGICFGNQQVGNTLPVIPGGSLIGSVSGTVTHGIDFSASTLTGYLIKGPNSGGIDGNNTVHTDVVQSATDDSISFRNSSGVALFNVAKAGTPVNSVGVTAVGTGNSAIVTAISGTDANVNLLLKGGGTSGTTAGIQFANGASTTIGFFAGVSGAVSYPQLTPAASGNILIDVGGTATGISVGPSAATGIIIGNASITTQILGTLKGAAGTFTANGSVATALSSVGPAGSHTTVQEWLMVTDTGGTVRYIPCF